MNRLQQKSLSKQKVSVKKAEKDRGQKGHQVHTLEMRSNPDRIIVHRNKKCANCGYALENQAAKSVKKRQIQDIPLPAMEIT